MHDSPSDEQKLAWIAGIAAFGDPAFNPKDTGSAFGSYDASRSGFWGPRAKWSEYLTAPVVSICRQGDFFCQYNKYVKLKTSDGPKEVAVADVGTVMKWAEDHHGYKPWPGVLDGTNRARLFTEHENYALKRDGDDAAYLLAGRMGLNGATSFGGSDPTDVVILIDSTAASAGAVTELQGRAAEFVNLVSDNVKDARIAVVDYKAATISGSNPYRVNVGSEFSSDPQAAITAIQEIVPGGGQYGVIYSAVNTINALPWRQSAEKVTLTLSSSRVCGQQYCSTEAGTGVAYPAYDTRPQNMRRAGVYTRDSQWFFENAGWTAAIDTTYESRPGQYAGSTVFIDELKRVFEEALMTADVPLAGTDKGIAGQTGYFNADAVYPFLASSGPRSLQWSSSWMGPLPIDDGGGATLTALDIGDESLSTTGESDELDLPEPEVPEIPADMGPTYQVNFDRPGIYEVSLTAYIDGQVHEWMTTVWVDEVPRIAPASPLLTSFMSDGD